MQPRSLDDRVTLLENRMQGLEDRVGRLDTRVTELTEQFVQFRQEVRAEFSATRDEIRSGDRAIADELREEMHALHAVAIAEINNAVDRSMRQARTLQEEVLARITLIDRG
jgi:hypothetical protein